MKRQALIEALVSVCGLLLWIIWFKLFPAMSEFWVYVPAILFGFVSIFMWKHREVFKVEDKMKKAYRNANILAFVGGAVCAVIFLFTIREMEWFSWGNWFIATMYAFLFCHAGGLVQFRDRERLKNAQEE